MNTIRKSSARRCTRSATGLAALTAKIAGRAGVATGTLFTYFANKKELVSELYFELKLAAYKIISYAREENSWQRPG
jgi:AcrR family transcriptional regulator